MSSSRQEPPTDSATDSAASQAKVFRDLRRRNERRARLAQVIEAQRERRLEVKRVPPAQRERRSRQVG
jgi:hypothetical protein